MAQNEKTFTVDEAERLIPQLEQCLDNIEKKKEVYAREHDLLFMHELLSQAENRGGWIPTDDNENVEGQIRELEAAIIDLQEDIDRIQSLGCRIRSVAKGVIDFLSERDGNPVYLSWQRGEKNIEYYYKVNESFEDRKPL